MAISRKWKIVLQFALIISISASTAGLAGGLTNKVSRWGSSTKMKDKIDTGGHLRNETVVEGGDLGNGTKDAMLMGTGGDRMMSRWESPEVHVAKQKRQIDTTYTRR
ncbi:hypothetical protein MBM_02629 [Drepanopeziza brunnea f. sp. 'multigermtubi' MB_m1]|uniref:Uncharacterized protein n=1 Tax=Marssonina brunnea f. sp. multigermtubi (strain MB_m1) TaxID=1072389 RepID=K1X2Z3_MARBU|nr:uncharacterized protein MBM_02629 [Drepanopeziza brunnea f. sp. 'multigermtubi' MB_m1]EKD19392.1 hypothetical protein MBM_02629 [Drepanopeziza brunnea f. sp. 'multigermtubi' MB_m1]